MTIVERPLRGLCGFWRRGNASEALPSNPNVIEVKTEPACPDTEGDIRTGRIDCLPSLSEVRQIRIVGSDKLITHLNGIELRILPIGQEITLP